MCKQVDYFKKIDLHAQQKIYFHVMQAQGGPSRAELWDKGPQSTPDLHLWLKTPVQTSSLPLKQKASPTSVILGSIFSPSKLEFGFSISAFFPCLY